MNRIRISLAVILVTVIFAIAISVISISYRRNLVPDMIQSNGCTAPCFFNKSLENRQQDEIYDLLKDSHLVDASSLRLIDNGQTMEWVWSEYGLERLTSSGLPISYGDTNTISFNGKHVSGVRMVFAIELSQLLHEFGEPEWITTAYSTRFGDLVFELIYEEPLGRFEVWTRCERPDLSAKSKVGAYIFSPAYKSNPTAAGYPLIVWAGYHSKLPDCSVFLP